MITHNFADFERRLREAARGSTDLTVPLREHAARFRKSREFIFDKNRGPTSQYKELKPATEKSKVKKYGFDYPVLLATGKLRDSITKAGGNNITVVTPKSLTVGTHVRYGIFHQAGTKHMPKREFLFWGPESPRFSSNAQVKKTNKALAVAIYTYIEQKTGKTLEAAITKAERKYDRVFG